RVGGANQHAGPTGSRAVRFSRHALERWWERHPTLDIEAELASAKRPSKRLRHLLEVPGQVVPEHLRERRRYLVTTNGVVFVLGEDDVVITVLRLGEAARRAKAQRRKDRTAASR